MLRDMCAVERVSLRYLFGIVVNLPIEPELVI